MKSSMLRWTATLSLVLGVLAIAAGLARRGAPAEEPKGRPKTESTSAYAPTPAAKPMTAEVLEVPADPAPESEPAAIRLTAREEGYREAKEGIGEGGLSGQVVCPGGPVPGIGVRAEWVMAVAPDRGEIQRLKRIGARRDRDGTWWARAVAVTDDSGGFRFEGLPAVPLRLRVGSSIQKSQIGEYATIRVEAP
jgi:hypothetical protein